MDSFDVNHKLNRSSSLSDLSTLTFASPTRNTSIYNSPVPKFVNLNTPFGKKGLVRHFSCEQIYDPRLGSSPLIRIKDTYSIPYQQGGDLCEPAWSNWSNFKTSLMASENTSELQQDNDQNQHQDEADIKVFGKLNNFDFSFTKDCEEKLDVIPMDIDKSLEKKSDDDVVDGDANLRKRRRVKKEDQDQGNPRKILKGSDEVDASAPGKFRTLALVFLFLVLPVSAYLGFVHNTELSVKDNLKVLSHNLFKQRAKCDQALDFQKTLQSLQQNLYGQDQMIQDLAKNFYTKNFKLLLLTGLRASVKPSPSNN
ncbi:uncharacterized protein LOC113378549 [Ctenocephalides felis]|uniref:uncharacterized protein LOC113378549 n=1 Tax=Ctenocephalides felis TaxID=7515 RepID=UPI000E6E3339|nr:uncharacterized protein LOC113378549 [Ctenocephalides felis]